MFDSGEVGIDPLEASGTEPDEDDTLISRPVQTEPRPSSIESTSTFVLIQTATLSMIHSACLGGSYLAPWTETTFAVITDGAVDSQDCLRTSSLSSDLAVSLICPTTDC